MPKLTAKIAEIAKIKPSKNEQLIFAFFVFFVVEKIKLGLQLEYGDAWAVRTAGRPRSSFRFPRSDPAMT
jgi:hypothetical protein